MGGRAGRVLRAFSAPPLIASLALASCAEPAQGQRGDVVPDLEGQVVLDVPFVPQSEDMCGAAAVTMAFRYWGDTDSRMSVFEPLVAPDGSGTWVLAGGSRWAGLPSRVGWSVWAPQPIRPLCRRRGPSA